MLDSCLWYNGRLRQYFCLYRIVSQRGRKKRKKVDERKNVQTNPPLAPTASAVCPCPAIIQISRLARHWMVCWLRLNIPLSISVYIGPFPREREREERHYKREKKCPNNPLAAPTASAVGPCPTIIQISRTPRHGKIRDVVAVKLIQYLSCTPDGRIEKLW